MKKRYKYPLFFLMGLGAVVATFGAIAYRNFGDLPDPARFSHLPYYQNGVFASGVELFYKPDKITGKRGLFYGAPFSPNRPKNPLPMEKLSAQHFRQPENFAYYWLGHASAIVELDGKRLLIDPVFGNAAPVPFVMPRFQAAPIARKDVPKIDLVGITHDHYDHLEADSMRDFAKRDMRFLVPLGVGARLQSWGVAADKITEIGWGESAQFDSIKFTAERTIHYSARTGRDRSKTLWAAYAIEGKNKKIFVAGDGGYGKQFAEYGKKYGGFDYALIEIDGGNLGWERTHMFPEQSVQAAQDLNAKILLPVHWGVFDMALNPWKQSISRADIAARQKGIPMHVPKMGERYTGEHYQRENWWENIE